MSTAELVYLMMNFVIYPCLIIMHTIIEQGVINKVFIETIDNLQINQWINQNRNKQINFVEQSYNL